MCRLVFPKTPMPGEMPVLAGMWLLQVPNSRLVMNITEPSYGEGCITVGYLIKGTIDDLFHTECLPKASNCRTAGKEI